MMCPRACNAAVCAITKLEKYGKRIIQTFLSVCFPNTMFITAKKHTPPLYQRTASAGSLADRNYKLHGKGSCSICSHSKLCRGTALVTIKWLEACKLEGGK